MTIKDHTYTELQSLSPESYLDPSLFVTPWDTLPANVARGYAQEQYQKGLAAGREYDEVCIACNGTWGGFRSPHCTMTSYEGIGYHACTADLLRGILDSGVKVVVYRYSLREGVTIKDSTK